MQASGTRNIGSRNVRVRLVRPAAGRRIGGVAAAIGNATGVDPNLVRVAFVVLAFAGGVGVALYLAAWLVLPSESAVAAGAARRRTTGSRRRIDALQVVALASIVLGTLLLVRELHFVFVDGIVWPVAVAGIGVALLWGRMRPEDRRASRAASSPWSTAVSALVGENRRPGSIARVACGAVLVVVAGAAFVTAQKSIAAREVLTTLIVLVAGLGLVFGPWLWRLGSDLTEERSERIRSQERAEVAAHLHDSVLHTLALVRRSADDPRQVVRLARRQERELRAWLAGGAAANGSTSLAAALDQTASEVEADHGVPVDVVKVGDCALDDGTGALVRAAREAMVNASRHSQAASIAVYLEVDDATAAIFVRDRGVGFCHDDVGPDRHGLAESIRGRMERHHGSAVVRTAPGEGTEVQLSVPRTGT
ncbi:MAG TPA: PspC domain-containing protein [Acidimicrobiia bacterium]|jgi:signal transduction histidine kinase